MMTLTRRARVQTIDMVMPEEVTHAELHSGSEDAAIGATADISEPVDIAMADELTSSTPARKCIASNPARIAGTATIGTRRRRRDASGRETRTAVPPDLA